MTRPLRITLAVVLAMGFLGSLSAWLRTGSTAQAAAPAAAPMTRTERLAKLGCDANRFSTVEWIGMLNGQAQVGMDREALVCALGTPDNVRTVTTAHGATEFHTFHRDGQRPLVVSLSNGIVDVIAD